MLGCALATPCPRDQVQMVYDVTTHLLLPDGSEQHGGNTSGHVYTGESLHQPLGLLSSRANHGPSAHRVGEIGGGVRSQAGGSI